MNYLQKCRIIIGKIIAKWDFKSLFCEREMYYENEQLNYLEYYGIIKKKNY